MSSGIDPDTRWHRTAGVPWCSTAGTAVAHGCVVRWTASTMRTGCRRADESAGARRSTTQLGPDLAGAVREIRDRHEHVRVVGSLNLVQTLLREQLFDRLDLWVHPIVLGDGKKVFDGGAVPTNVTLLEPPVASPKGTVYLRYGRADGTPGTGDISAPDRAAGRDN